MRLGSPPIPREHGAWVMLYVPFAVGSIAAWPTAIAPLLLLLLAVTGAFLSRHVLGMALRQRNKRAASNGAANQWPAWLAIYGTLTAVGILPLIVAFHRLALLELAAIAAAILMLHSLFMVWPARHRLDRSQVGELVGATALTLAAPAAYATATGVLNAKAWLLWIVCSLFFGSGVSYVQMLLSGLKCKRVLSQPERWKVGRTNLCYHVALCAALICFLAYAKNAPALITAIAFCPVIVRSFWGTLRLTDSVPVFKKVGVCETIYSLWFAVFYCISHRV
jgi:hypothetical protein